MRRRFLLREKSRRAGMTSATSRRSRPYWNARRERRQTRWKARRRSRRFATGANRWCSVARGFAHAANAHARDGRPVARTSGKCDLKERRGAKARFKMAVQVSPGCQVNVREEGTRKRRRERVTKERGVPHGSQAVAKRKVTPKRWHAAAPCRLCRNGFLCLDITGSLGLTCCEELFSLANTNIYIYIYFSIFSINPCIYLYILYP